MNTKSKRASARRRELYRYAKWRYYRYTSKRAAGERAAKRKHWWGLYEAAKTERQEYDRQLAREKAAQLRYRLGWRSLQKVAGGKSVLSDAKAKEYALVLGEAMQKFGINTKNRAAMFIAQVAHESASFRTLEEYASGAAYEGRRALGNMQKGDGVRFKGRGFIQITGRSNYAAVSKALGVDFVKNPSKLAQPEYAAEASAWWWTNAGLNKVADGGPAAIRDVTHRINGGYNGLADRQAKYARARKVAAYLVPKRRKP